MSAATEMRTIALAHTVNEQDWRFGFRGVWAIPVRKNFGRRTVTREQRDWAEGKEFEEIQKG